ncbi:MAG: hypothetical protein KC777_05345 [Cyanobacteria bacterium HKST-UBA02]|nr:hypothetical protein [Cyanobacteria bacterium HKST-UBA02]
MLHFALAFFLFVCCIPVAGAEVDDYDLLSLPRRRDEVKKERKKAEDRDVERKIAGDQDDENDDDADDRRRDLIERWTDDFIDTDFKKKSFDDLKDLDGSRAEVGGDKDVKPDEPDAHDLRRDDIKYLFSDDFDDRYKAREEEKKTFKDLTKPIPGMLHDWVPDHVNRLQNGAFVKEPDNGFPVPYRLNGHLDIQRKLPWEKEP